MRYLTILAFSSMILSAFAQEEMNAYKLMPESKSCAQQCKPVKKVAVKKPAKKINKSTPAYSMVLKKQAEEMKKMQARQANLELELKKLREANLILAAKQDETPRTTVQLAATGVATQVSPGVSIPVQTTVVSTTAEVAKDVEAAPASKISGFVVDEVETVLSVPADGKGRTVSNTIYTETDYKYSEPLYFRISEGLSWNWVTEPGKKNEATFGDVGLWAVFPIVTNDEGFSAKGHFIFDLPTSKESRDETKILSPKFRLELPTKFDDKKGFFRIRTQYTYIFRKYTTGTGTGTHNTDKPENYVEIGSSIFEKVPQYAIDQLFVRLDLNYNITPKVAFCNEFRWIMDRTYEDSVISNGQTFIISPAGVNHSIMLKNYLGINFTDTLILEAGVYNKLPSDKFSLFKDSSFVATLVYLF